jgi:hypothetical protein
MMIVFFLMTVLLSPLITAFLEFYFKGKFGCIKDHLERVLSALERFFKREVKVEKTYKKTVEKNVKITKK